MFGYLIIIISFFGLDVYELIFCFKRPSLNEKITYYNYFKIYEIIEYDYFLISTYNYVYFNFALL
jgi:hypothetical protein